MLIRVAGLRLLMARNVEVPDPPELTNRGLPSAFADVEAVGGAADLRRDELEAILADGAWQDAFDEWSEYTDLTPAEIGVLRDAGLFESFDIYWDPAAESLDYEPPSIPHDWGTKARAAGVDSPVNRSLVVEAIDDLGRMVVETIEDAYLRFEDEADDYVWSVDTFGQAPEHERERED